MTPNLKQIFTQTEATLKKQLGLSEEEYNKKYFSYNDRKFIRRTDEEYFTIMKHIIFYSGFRAEKVTKRLPVINKHLPGFKTVACYDGNIIDEILDDPHMIRNRGKINAIVKNAKVFIKLIEKHKSFHDYIVSFHPEKSLENLFNLQHDLQRRFGYLGEITACHFLSDIGLNILKPDLVITRIFHRLGLIENEKLTDKAIEVGRKFAEETGYAIRYIDIVFVTYGQNGGPGVCLGEKPKCDVCGVRGGCGYLG